MSNIKKDICPTYDKDKYIAEQCLDCGSISVFPSTNSDGVRCLICEGQTRPIGYTKISPRIFNNAKRDISIPKYLKEDKLRVKILKRFLKIKSPSFITNPKKAQKMKYTL